MHPGLLFFKPSLAFRPEGQGDKIPIYKSAASCNFLTCHAIARKGQGWLGFGSCRTRSFAGPSPQIGQTWFFVWFTSPPIAKLHAISMKLPIAFTPNGTPSLPERRLPHPQKAGGDQGGAGWISVSGFSVFSRRSISASLAFRPASSASLAASCSFNFWFKP